MWGLKCPSLRCQIVAGSCLAGSHWGEEEVLTEPDVGEMALGGVASRTYNFPILLAVNPVILDWDNYII